MSSATSQNAASATPILPDHIDEDRKSVV